MSKQPNVFSLGCLCHLAALCAAALKRLPVSIDELQIDFDKEAESDRNAHLQRVAKHINNPEVKLLCHSVSYALKGFTAGFLLPFKHMLYSRIGSL